MNPGWASVGVIGLVAFAYGMVTGNAVGRGNISRSRAINPKAFWVCQAIWAGAAVCGAVMFFTNQ